MGQHRTTGMICLAAVLLGLMVSLIARGTSDIFPLYQVQSQDLPILIALPPLLILTILFAPRLPLPDRLPPRPVLILSGGILVALLGWGSHALMGDFPLSRDEHMVVFDMAVFDKGRIAAPLAPAWRAYAETLVPAFLAKMDNPLALVSDYLPANAWLRLAFSRIADPAFFNPMLVLVGALALHDIAKRAFGADVRARWVVFLIYALSTQMLVTAMTTYAMTAHMALNLVWLAAFLRGGRAGHGVAILTGFVAMGLHQIVFHPLFVAPFLLWRLRDGQWRLVLLYGAAYLAMTGCWVGYSHWAATAAGGVAAHGAAGPPDNFFVRRVLPLLVERDPLTIPYMILNLLRFVAWQNLALLPLLVAALPLGWRDRGVAGPLLWGVVLLLVFISFILPFQGHGWGYRYLHQLLGSFALLGGFGYRRLADRIGTKADGLVWVLSAATLLGAMPVLLARVDGFVAPHVALERTIAARRSDFVLIDTSVSPSTDGRWTANAIDHVRNRPDLDNHPLRFSSRTMTAPMLAELCRRGTLSLVTRADMHHAGFAPTLPEDSPRFRALVGTLGDARCLRRP
ncbi:hypothetical protein LWE61_12990 [Sphingobium sufflavum]|uniref:hypothetical protein n=1 Tax=Sphingobium sufflavum TaxID=1129547 RepID=UPI001F1BC67A|nr:hypothetical protein [Sphingobium sufflavum]MCE7797467.1 hypothetical protein [Sphingobium sufflavum]